MNTLVIINQPKEEWAKKQLKSSAAFSLNPFKIMEEDNVKISIKLFDCNTKEEMDHKLDCLAEASSIDFSYSYRINC